MNDLTLEQKLWLAGRLPELIQVYRNPQFPTAPTFFWIGLYDFGSRIAITNREWLWVVAEVEGQLTSEQQDKYIYRLSKISKVFNQSEKFGLYKLWDLLQLPASQRTSALMKVMEV